MVRVAPLLFILSACVGLVFLSVGQAQETNSPPAKATPAVAEAEPVVDAAEEEEKLESPPPFPGLEPDVQRQLDVFFLLVQRGKVDGAYDALVRGTVYEGREADVLVLKEKTRQAIQLFGEIRRHEVLEMRRVGEHLLSVTVLSLGEKYPLRWKLYFYHSRDAWRLIDIRVDDRLVSLFGEEDPPTPSPTPR